ncbi:MAG TPA: AMP-binding protein, partial [Longimicrobiales bacterium]|nr:AMP-binding protein [Longimicrobiales bacterium]
MSVELIQRAAGHGDRVAIVDAEGAHTYAGLLAASARVAGALLHDASDLQGARVAFLIAPGFAHAAVQWGIWRAGGVAVPLGLTHPEPEL